MSKFELVNIRSESLDTVKPSSKLNGKILKWNDEKGFGFIKPESGSEEIFFHIRSFRMGELRPRAGMQVSFELGVDREGRKQAQYVGLLTISASPILPSSRRLLLQRFS